MVTVPILTFPPSSLVYHFLPTPITTTRQSITSRRHSVYAIPPPRPTWTASCMEKNVARSFPSPRVSTVVPFPSVSGSMVWIVKLSFWMLRQVQLQRKCHNLGQLSHFARRACSRPFVPSIALPQLDRKRPLRPSSGNAWCIPFFPSGLWRQNWPEPRRGRDCSSFDCVNSVASLLFALDQWSTAYLFLPTTIHTQTATAILLAFGQDRFISIYHTIHNAMISL
jgi:hypothetical protein